jgi:hypothetical protein
MNRELGLKTVLVILGLLFTAAIYPVTMMLWSWLRGNPQLSEPLQWQRSLDQLSRGKIDEFYRQRSSEKRLNAAPEHLEWLCGNRYFGVRRRLRDRFGACIFC